MQKYFLFNFSFFLSKEYGCVIEYKWVAVFFPKGGNDYNGKRTL